MTKKEFDKECKICSKPFTVFRWRPGHKARFKKTEIWQTCARSKNVCQTCIFDLEFGLPVQVRDNFLKDCDALGIASDDITTREFKDPEMREKLEVLAKKYPSYKRNRAHICSFFIKGTCTRGENWPYRHEYPSDEEEVKVDENGKKIKNLSVEQSIRDRFHGVNDSLAGKILHKIKKNEKPSPPENKNITTLFVGGVDETLKENDISEFFKKYGKVKGIRIRLKSQWAFVWFDERESAELAMDHLFNKLFIKEKQLKLLWAKDQLDLNKNKRTAEEFGSLPGIGGNGGAQKLKIEDKTYLPSMDPSNYVSKNLNYIGWVN